jgi:hypothetical protein
MYTTYYMITAPCHVAVQLCGCAYSKAVCRAYTLLQRQIGGRHNPPPILLDWAVHAMLGLIQCHPPTNRWNGSDLRSDPLSYLKLKCVILDWFEKKFIGERRACGLHIPIPFEKRLLQPQCKGINFQHADQRKSRQRTLSNYTCKNGTWVISRKWPGSSNSSTMIYQKL